MQAVHRIHLRQAEVALELAHQSVAAHRLIIAETATSGDGQRAALIASAMLSVENALIELRRALASDFNDDTFALQHDQARLV